MASCLGTWWAIFVGGSELPNLTLWHDMPTILNGVSASRPTFTNLPTFNSVQKKCGRIVQNLCSKWFWKGLVMLFQISNTIKRCNASLKFY